MYNAFMAKRNTFDIEEMKRKSKKNKLYVDRYYHKVRPSLIDNYNKRINTFIRKVSIISQHRWKNNLSRFNLIHHSKKIKKNLIAKKVNSQQAIVFVLKINKIGIVCSLPQKDYKEQKIRLFSRKNMVMQILL